MKKKSVSMLLVLIFITSAVVGQRAIVRGVVKNQSNEDPIQGATITSKTQKNSTISGENGEFSIEVKDLSDQLEFTHAGYEILTYRLNGSPLISVFMKANFENLDEVIVVGYGTARKRDLTGSISSVTAKDIEGQAANSIEQALQGRAAGVQITQSDAAPDGGISVVIRGSNSIAGGTEPLYVIDGVPVSGGNIRVKGTEDNFGPAGDLQEMSQAPNMLSFLNPADIESVQILKDASATAIYGSRGANGVVLITTKQGVRGSTKVQLSSATDVANVYRKMDLLSGPEFAEAQNLRYIINRVYAAGSTYEAAYDGRPYRGTYASNGTYTPSPEDYADGTATWTDWQDVIFRTGISTRNNISISGGADKTRYYTGLSYDNLKGTIINSDFKRYSLNNNFETSLWGKIIFRNSFKGSLTKSDRAQTGNIHAGAHRGIITAIYRYSPLVPIGSVWYSEENGILTNSDDPYTLATKFLDIQTGINVLENMSFRVPLARGLALDISGGLRYNNDLREMYYPLSTVRGQTMGSGSAFSGRNESMYLVNENILTYNKKIKQHSLSLMGGFTQEKTVFRTSSNSVSGFLSDETLYYNLGITSAFRQPVSDYIETSLLSGIGRATYNFGDRYLFTASLRADGSSKFGINNKWGYFPSASVAWRINQEAFMANAKSVSDLKLRLSYGVTGNQGVAPYQSMARLGATNYPFNGTLATGLQNSGLANPDLRWEKTTQFNLGVDIGFFDQRLTFTGNIYQKNTTDLLQSVTLAPNTGYSQQLKNMGALTNRGFELELSGVPIRKKNLQWRVSANAYRNLIKVTSLGDLQEYPGGYTLWWDWRPYRIMVGEPLGILYGYKIDKVMKTAEDVANAANNNPRKAIGEYDYVKDADGNMALMKIGNTNPDISFGFSNELTYKQWGLNFLVAGSLGQDIFNLNLRVLQSESQQNLRSNYYNAWVPEIKNAQGEIVYADNGKDMPVFRSINGRTYNFPIDHMIEDGSWVKLRNVTLSYMLEAKKSRYIKGLKLYVSGANLLVIDNYSGLDPEASVYGQDPTRRGTAYGEYPMARTFTFGINATF
ncbi:MAG: TonB-dependent receptor [Niabella sp.]